MRVGMMLAAAAALVLGAGQASADEITQAAQFTNLSGSYLFNKFDPSLGTLLEVIGQYSTYSSAQVRTASYSGGLGLVTYRISGPVYLGIVGLNLTPSYSGTYQVNFALGQTSGTQTIPYTFTGGFDLTQPNDLLNFVASSTSSKGTFVPVVFPSISASNSTGYVDSSILTSAEGFVSDATSLTFIYAVPEPATWAMMIAGFGAIGALARRRSRRSATAAA